MTALLTKQLSASENACEIKHGEEAWMQVGGFQVRDSCSHKPLKSSQVATESPQSTPILADGGSHFDTH